MKLNYPVFRVTKNNDFRFLANFAITSRLQNLTQRSNSTSKRLEQETLTGTHECNTAHALVNTVNLRISLPPPPLRTSATPNGGNLK